jgi:4'-phosphopantetheinyl transferase EntD
MTAGPGEMLASLLPAGVEVVSATDPAAADPLHPEEAATVAGAMEKRRLELTLSRHCARRALRALGAPTGPLLPGPAREPRWPAGVRGSITHCPGLCAAAVAWASQVGSLGIDAEPNEALPEGVADMVTLPEERTWLGRAPDTGIAWDRLVFSAKESVYKTWFPLTGRWLGFEEARLRLDPAAGTFRADLLAPTVIAGREVAGFDGRFAAVDGLLLTAVALAPTPAGERPTDPR